MVTKLLNKNPSVLSEVPPHKVVIRKAMEAFGKLLFSEGDGQYTDS